MITVAISQRVSEEHVYFERRDCLDVRWAKFLEACDIVPLIIPNHLKLAEKIVEHYPPNGFILTGGNDLGEIKEREAVETFFLSYALAHKKPVIGICRGMQFMHVHAGGELTTVPSHAGTCHELRFGDICRSVNSYHKYGFKTVTENYDAVAFSSDGVVEAMRHKKYDWFGQMWHPERQEKFASEDIECFRRMFS